jgi:hypothetical protein
VEGVKTAAIAMGCLFLATLAEGVVKVEPIVPIECSPRVRITVLLEGQPIPGVDVNLYDGTSASKRPIFSARPNRNGIVRPPALAFGTYRVDAILRQNSVRLENDEIRNLIWLKVIPNSEVSTALLDLTNARNGARESAKQFEDRLGEADHGPRAHLRVFEGTVLDPLGTLIPSAEVKVFQSTSQGWVVRLRTTSDPRGYFSSETLAPGQYVAVFSAGGCRLAMVPFETGQDPSGKLRVKLRIGFTDVSVPRDSSRIATTDNWQLTTDN